MKMLVLGQAPSGALSTRRCYLTSPPKFSNPNPPLFSSHRPSRFFSNVNPSKSLNITLAKADGGVDSASSADKQGFSASSAPPPPPPPSVDNQPVFVGQENIPLEGVIQFQKPDSSARLRKWGHVALLAGGDVLALLTFAAIGRFSHGFPVFEFETLRTADPFIAGWFLSAYFLGGFGEDGRGVNGQSKALTATAKSWALGIPSISVAKSRNGERRSIFHFTILAAWDNHKGINSWPHSTNQIRTCNNGEHWCFTRWMESTSV